MSANRFEVPDPGAFGSLAPEQVRRLDGITYHAVARLVRDRRSADEWSVGFLYAVHRDLFGDIFPDQAGRERRADVMLGGLPVPAYGQVAYRLSDLVDHAKRTIDLSRNMVVPSDRIRAVFGEAARFHASCVTAQPFIDGNKRWARVVLGALLTDCGYYPGTIITKDQHSGYMDGIRKAILEDHPQQLTELILRGWITQRERYRRGLH